MKKHTDKKQEHDKQNDVGLSIGLSTGLSLGSAIGIMTHNIAFWISNGNQLRNAL